MNLELLTIFAGIPTCTYEETVTQKTVGGIVLSIWVVYLYIIYKAFKKRWHHDDKPRPDTLTYILRALTVLALLIIGTVGLFYIYLINTPLCR